MLGSVVVRLVRVSQVEDYSAVWLSSASVGKLGGEVDAAVETQAAIRKDINPLRLKIGRGVDDTNLAGLNKIIGNQQVLLIRTDLQIMWTNDTLILIRVIQSLDVVKIRNVKCCDMVADCKREIGELAVVGDVRVDGEVLASAWTKIVQ